MRRREALRLVGAGTVPLAGCLAALESSDDGGTPAPEDGREDTVAGDGSDSTSLEATATETAESVDPAPGPDEECPTTQGFDVEWPTDVDRDAAEAFVAAYEPRYHREVDFAYEPETRLDSYEGSGEVPAQAKSWGDGWQVVFAGSGGVYRPTLRFTAKEVEPPADATIVPGRQVDDEWLRDLLADAAGVGDPGYQTASEPVTRRIRRSKRASAVPRYLDLLDSLSDAFDALTEARDAASTFVDVDGTPVELTAVATRYRRALSWTAWYYVDERVVRRQRGDDSDGDIDSRTGTLVECRKLD